MVDFEALLGSVCPRGFCSLLTYLSISSSSCALTIFHVCKNVCVCAYIHVCICYTPSRCVGDYPVICHDLDPLRVEILVRDKIAILTPIYAKGKN